LKLGGQLTHVVVTGRAPSVFFEKIRPVGMVEREPEIDVMGKDFLAGRRLVGCCERRRACVLVITLDHLLCSRRADHGERESEDNNSPIA
jgi:hypothetical protein